MLGFGIVHAIGMLAGQWLAQVYVLGNWMLEFVGQVLGYKEILEKEVETMIHNGEVI